MVTRRNGRWLVVLGTVPMAICSVIGLVAQPRGSYLAARPGWLYVATAEFPTQAGHVLVVDPEHGRVVSQFDAGLRPDILPSKDGTRLYLAFDQLQPESGGGRLQGVFQVLDAVTGSVLSRIEEPYARGGMPTAYSSDMVLSRDGVWLFRFKRQYSTTSGPSYWVETFDTSQNSVLPDTVPLSLCGDGSLHPGPQRELVYAVCPDSQDVRVLTLSPSGGNAAGRPRRISFGSGHAEGFVTPAFLADADQTLTVVKTNGAFTKIAVDSGTVIQRDAIDRVARRAPIPDERPELGRPTQPTGDSDWLAQRKVGGLSAALSPDQSTFYVMTQGTRSPAVSFVALKASTLERVRSIPSARSFVSFTLSRDGKFVYAVDREESVVAVIDSTTGTEVRAIQTSGRRPVFAVVAP